MREQQNVSNFVFKDSRVRQERSLVLVDVLQNQIVDERLGQLYGLWVIFVFLPLELVILIVCQQVFIILLLCVSEHVILVLIRWPIWVNLSEGIHLLRCFKLDRLLWQIHHDEAFSKLFLQRQNIDRLFLLNIIYPRLLSE